MYLNYKILWIDNNIEDSTSVPLGNTEIQRLIASQSKKFDDMIGIRTLDAAVMSLVPPHKRNEILNNVRDFRRKFLRQTQLNYTEFLTIEGLDSPIMELLPTVPENQKKLVALTLSKSSQILRDL